VSPPETRYAKSGDHRIAYQVVGDGPIDMVVLPGFLSNVELTWESDFTSEFFGRLAAFSRLILFDKRGMGLSDPVPTDELPGLQERVDDALAVMDAAGVERAAFLGISEGGQTGMWLAATHPDRVKALALVASFAAIGIGEGATDDGVALVRPFGREVLEAWGTGASVDVWAPSMVRDPEQVALLAKWERQSARPAMVMPLARIATRTDVRHLLPSISVPTLVVHRTRECFIDVRAARYVAEHIPGARMVEVPGVDHVPYTEYSSEILDAVEEFLTGSLQSAMTDRVLATLVFTDIVGSTERAADLGDAAWRTVLDDLDRVVTREVGAARGRVVKFTGDGHLATFDGPARAIRCAEALAGAARGLGLELRSGIHTGEVELRGDDVGGIAVHIAARVMAMAGASEVLVSGAVPPLVAGSGIEFSDRGVHSLKGVPGEWQLHEVKA
jgi:pimeloyl-ACP methyl ester carboxylesterase